MKVKSYNFFCYTKDGVRCQANTKIFVDKQDYDILKKKLDKVTKQIDRIYKMTLVSKCSPIINQIVDILEKKQKRFEIK